MTPFNSGARPCRRRPCARKKRGWGWKTLSSAISYIEVEMACETPLVAPHSEHAAYLTVRAGTHFEKWNAELSRLSANGGICTQLRPIAFPRARHDHFVPTIAREYDPMSTAVGYDYIIIGAGSAGCVLAYRLSEDPGATILLLEAGGADRHPYVQIPLGLGKLQQRRMFDWGYDSEPEPGLNDRRLAVFRGKVLGGSSSVNVMLYTRGHRGDFDRWARQGAIGCGEPGSDRSRR